MVMTNDWVPGRQTLTIQAFDEAEAEALAKTIHEGWKCIEITDVKRHRTSQEEITAYVAGYTAGLAGDAPEWTAEDIIGYESEDYDDDDEEDEDE